MLPVQQRHVEIPVFRLCLALSCRLKIPLRIDAFPRRVVLSAPVSCNLLFYDDIAAFPVVAGRHIGRPHIAVRIVHPARPEIGLIAVCKKSPMIIRKPDMPPVDIEPVNLIRNGII